MKTIYQSLLLLLPLLMVCSPTVEAQGGATEKGGQATGESRRSSRLSEAGCKV
jgi:hypothetical protein